MPCVAEHVARDAAFDHFARVHDDDGIAQFRDHAEMMRDEQDRAADVALQLLQAMDDLHFQRGVQRRGRLVGDQQGGLGHQRHRDGDPLAHATGQLVRVSAQLRFRIRNADPFEHPLRASILRAAAGGAAMLNVRHLPADGPDRVQAGHRVLEDDRDLVTAQRPHFVRRQAEKIPTLEPDRPVVDTGIRGEQPDDRGDQRGLAAAAFADDADDPAFRNHEADVPQRGQAALPGLVGHRQVLDFQHRGAHASFLRNFGSKMSRSDSPKNVNPSVTAISGRPPAMIGHGEFLR